MASIGRMSKIKKPKRGKRQADISTKDIISIMTGRFNRAPLPRVAVGNETSDDMEELSSVVPIHKMAMCRVCGKLGCRLRFLTPRRDVCSQDCVARATSTTSGTALPTPWIDFEADLTAQLKREVRCPERSLRRRTVLGSFRWQEAFGDNDLQATAVQRFPHAPAGDIWQDFTPDSLLPALVVESELPSSEGSVSHALWPARVQAVRGYMACLRFEGVADKAKDFWVNLAAQTYPLGWAAATGRPLVPPKSAALGQLDDAAWRDFLSEQLRNTRTFPWNFPRQMADGQASRFQPGLRLELVDRDRIRRLRLARVEAVVARRLHLRYLDSRPEDPGFVCHQDSPLIHPVGWARRVGAELIAPEEYLRRCVTGDWLPTDAKPELFAAPPTFEARTTGEIRAGMKMEAIDPLNLSAICVASVMKVLKEGYLMVRIDSYEEDEDGSRADWFCYHMTSPNVFPAGFCARYGLKLVPPKSDPSFTWGHFLNRPGNFAVPLPPRPALSHGFCVGHRLEAADLMDPRMICAASVSHVVGRLLRVHFDGWGAEYDQWMDAHSPDIYPVGWCDMAGHRLEPPRVETAGLGAVFNVTPRPPREPSSAKLVDVADPEACPILDPVSPVRTAGSAPKDPPSVAEQSTARLRSSTGPPRLSLAAAPRPQGAAPRPPLAPPRTHGSRQRLPTRRSALEAAKKAQKKRHRSESDEWSEEDVPLVQRLRASRSLRSGQRDGSPRPAPSPKVNLSAPVMLAQRKEGGVTIPANVDDDPFTWTKHHVAQFLAANDCHAFAHAFVHKGIDGPTFLTMNDTSIILLTSTKVGPALLIGDLIAKLKTLVRQRKLPAARRAL